MLSNAGLILNRENLNAVRCAEKAAEALGQGSAEIEIVLKERLFGDIHPVKIVPATVSNRERLPF